MKTKAPSLTLANIKKLFTSNNIGLARMMDEKIHAGLARNNVLIFAEMDKIHNEIASHRAETTEQFIGVNGAISKLSKEMNHRFDEVDNKLQNILQETSDIADQKLENFRQKYLATEI